MTQTSNVSTKLYRSAKPDMASPARATTLATMKLTSTMQTMIPTMMTSIKMPTTVILSTKTTPIVATPTMIHH